MISLLRIFGQALLVRDDNRSTRPLGFGILEIRNPWLQLASQNVTLTIHYNRIIVISLCLTTELNSIISKK